MIFLSSPKSFLLLLLFCFLFYDCLILPTPYFFFYFLCLLFLNKTQISKQNNYLYYFHGSVFDLDLFTTFVTCASPRCRWFEFERTDPSLLEWPWLVRIWNSCVVMLCLWNGYELLMGYMDRLAGVAMLGIVFVSCCRFWNWYRLWCCGFEVLCVSAGFDEWFVSGSWWIFRGKICCFAGLCVWISAVLNIVFCRLFYSVRILG
jgi:hypothetical protein